MSSNSANEKRIGCPPKVNQISWELCVTSWRQRKLCTNFPDNEQRLTGRSNNDAKGDSIKVLNSSVPFSMANTSTRYWSREYELTLLSGGYLYVEKNALEVCAHRPCHLQSYRNCIVSISRAVRKGKKYAGVRVYHLTMIAYNPLHNFHASVRYPSFLHGWKRHCSGEVEKVL